MEDYIWIFVLVLLWVFFVAVSWVRETLSNSKKYIELRPQLDNLDFEKKQFEKNKDEVNARLNEESRKCVAENNLRVMMADAEIASKTKKLVEATESAKNDLLKISKQKSMGFPWLAEAYAEYFSLRDLRRKDYLEKKPHPAFSAAEIVREVKNEKKLLQRENKIISYKLNYFQNLFPWLTELIGENEDDEIPVSIDGDRAPNSESEDRVKDYLTPEEYRSLPSVERNQIALDRYLKNRNKSQWAVGRDYEMYIGYLFSQKGYSVEYKGIIDGYEDMGRDVIAKKSDETCIIQCKYWAQRKHIHEKHVFQLFGTTMEYWIKNNDEHSKQKHFRDFALFLNEDKLRPILFTSTTLSQKAKEIAQVLSVEVVEGEPIGDFPRIKCNINSDEFGLQTKIYHLPMDQQYDRTIIGNRRGEFYAFTVLEAEAAGFRRAFKHNF